MTIEKVKDDKALKYQEKNSLNKMKEFEAFVEKAKIQEPYKTGFVKLDECLDGGFRSGLVTLFANPGIGKSTFALQICDNIARSGRDVIFFALEMSRNELISKSLSRLSYENADRMQLPKSSNCFLYGYKQDNLTSLDSEYMESCKESYKQFAEHIFIEQSDFSLTVSKIKKRIDEHIQITGNIPFVIIDYTQIITPEDSKFSEKQNIDNSILELKKLTVEKELTILAISSVNRQSYSEKLGMGSAKESGGIEYTSSIILGLEYKGYEEKGKWKYEEQSQDQKNITLRIIKNRFGLSNVEVPFTFLPKYSYFEADGGNAGFANSLPRRVKNTENSDDFRVISRRRQENVF